MIFPLVPACDSPWTKHRGRRHVQGVNGEHRALIRADLPNHPILQSTRRVLWPHAASTSRRPPLLWQPDSGHRLCAELQGGSVFGPSRGCLRRILALPLRVRSVRCWKLPGGGAGHVYPAQCENIILQKLVGQRASWEGGSAGSLGAPRHASVSWGVHQ